MGGFSLVAKSDRRTIQTIAAFRDDLTLGYALSDNFTKVVTKEQCSLLKNYGQLSLTHASIHSRFRSKSFLNEPVDKSTWTENAGLHSHLRSILYWLGCSSTFTELATTDDWVDYVQCLDTLYASNLCGFLAMRYTPTHTQIGDSFLLHYTCVPGDETVVATTQRLEQKLQYEHREEPVNTGRARYDQHWVAAHMPELG